MAESDRLRLLLIDEGAQDRALATLVLERAFPGAQIREVFDAEGFAAALHGDRFDVVVTECLLSWSDGLAVARAVRAARPEVPLVAFSELRDEEVVVEAMKSGFADFVFKGSKGFLELPMAVEAVRERARNRLLASRSEPWLATLLDRADIGVYRSTLDGRLIESTPTLLRLLGVEGIEDALRLSLPEPHFLLEDREDLLERLSSDRTLRSREVRIENADGSHRWLSLTEVLLVDIDEDIVIDVLVQDITGLIERQEKLQKNLRELERSNADLSQFAYMASHELQQPLRMVEKFGAILAEEYSAHLGSDGTELLETVIEGASRMQDLIDDLLALSRIDTEGGEMQQVDSNQVLHEAILSIEDLIDENDASIRSDRLPQVWGDHQQLVQLWRNLISNAIKFRREETPEIAISAEQTADDWVFSIEDNGIGIEAEELEGIFVIFRRLQPELPGTGIGLSISKRIVERHGGRLWAESIPGEGSRFRFSLPKTDPEEIETDT